MEIKENILLDELENIFVENNKNYVADKECIKDDEFLKIVAVENGQALGYATLYFGSDFLQRENFPLRINIEHKFLYIWNCITKRNYEHTGVQTAIFNYIKQKFADYDMYSVVDVVNIPSMQLHKKMGFIKEATFDKEFLGRVCNFQLLRLTRK